MEPNLRLDVRMLQKQILSPQMQHSLAILQAPLLELKALVDKELQQNPCVEEVPDGPRTEESSTPSSESSAPTDDASEAAAGAETEAEGKAIDALTQEFERLAQLDDSWRDHFAGGNITPRNNPEEESRHEFMIASLTADLTLQDHLLEQAHLSELNNAQREIADLLIGNIDDNGFLQIDLADLAQQNGKDVGLYEAVLKVIQSFTPAGVGARNLRECLLLQMEAAGIEESLEYQLVNDHMDALGRHRYPDISKALDIDVVDIQKAAERIAKLSPRPGLAISSDHREYVIPEIFVELRDGQYEVTNNNDQIPKVRISNSYKDLMSQAGSSKEVRDYLRTKIRDGKFLIRSIHQRQETLLNIAREIVKRQHEFMEQGISQLKPMTMNQVAEVVKIHETTVSRAVAGKYMKTPQGLFEMRYFFTSGYKSSDGIDMANTTVKDMIAEIVKAEPKHEPISDENIVKLLIEKKVKIARRTVAKYRGELNILPSHMRKVY
ncbi:MAG: RNA polymerase sigma-54 factor [Pedosphaera sp.]|nr:RNA polymerase sigma-54 factor [Pedosphaera sp.]